MPIQQRPQKRFGQNFLTNKHYASKIVNSIEISDSDAVLEIGPGRGVLTELISAKNCKKRIAVEIDMQLAAQLRSNYTNIEILQQDILSFSFDEHFKQSKNKLKIVGNIPYNITSPILFHLLDNSSYISQAVLMIQKEVAERLIAKKDSKEYGILTILVNAQANVEKLFVVNRNNFYPQPKVDSMVIRLQFFKDDSEIENYALFKKIVKATFNNRRKMLKNSIKKLVDEQILNEIKSVPLNLRPENLTVNDFFNLVNEIAQIQSY
jgi:16S rRNA (adenine1518-N6/adenine1519-N6)-dimethyltransferase